MHVHMQYTQACICTYCDLLFTICIIYVYTYIYNYSFLCFYMRCSVEMFLNVSSLFFITKIIDIVKMTPLVFEHVSTLTKNSVCVCMFAHYPHIYACLCVRHQVGHMRCIPYPPPKFNTAPEKLPSQQESSLPTTIFQGLC